MELVWVIAVSIALGMDAFSFSLALGLLGIGNRTAVRLAGIVAIFHVFMPLIGLWAGQKLGVMFGDIAIGIGALIVLWLGGKMIWGGFKGTDTPCHTSSLRGLGIYALACSVSLDALSVGFSLGTFVTRIAPAVLIMGVTAGIMTAGGIVIGRGVGTWVGGKAEILGGVILFLIGIKMGVQLFS